MLTSDRLKELVVYNPENGEFVSQFDGTSRVKKTRIKKGDVLGFLTGKYYKEGRGYVTLYLDKKQYKAHRLAFLYMTGEWPIHQYDLS